MTSPRRRDGHRMPHNFFVANVRVDESFKKIIIPNLKQIKNKIALPGVCSIKSFFSVIYGSVI